MVYWVVSGTDRVGDRANSQNIQAWGERFPIVRVISSQVFLVGWAPMVRYSVSVLVQVILIANGD